ncbi:MAG: PQQ-dependent sugar dehydrogenase [Sumerlaeia bacterium]
MRLLPLMSLLAALTAAPAVLALPPGFSVNSIFVHADLRNPDPVDPTSFQGHPNTLEALPDGRVFIGMMDNRAYLWDPEADVNADGTGILPQLFLDYRGLVQGEMGMLGCVASPDFAQTGHFFVSYTRDIPPYDPETGFPQDRRIRIERFTADPSDKNAIVPGSGTIIFDIPDANLASVIHFAGGLEFGGDGKLFLSLGEDGLGGNSQDLTSFRGKILRMNPDGTPAPGNPFAIDSTLRPENYIWALGLRNPFRLYYDAVSDVMYSTDTGGGVWEEVNVIEPGANYGWPEIEGPAAQDPIGTPPPNHRDPFLAYPHGPEPLHGNAIVSLLAYRGGMFPEDWTGDIILSDWGFLPAGEGTAGEYLRLEIDDATGEAIGLQSIYQYPNDQPGGGDMTVLPDGSLLIAMTAYVFGQIDRISYRDPNEPPSLSASASATDGEAPLTVQFSATASGDGNPTLLWDFGDGTTSDGGAVTHTFTDPGRYPVKVTATNDMGISADLTLEIGAYARVPAISVSGRVFNANVNPAEPTSATVTLLDADGKSALLSGAVPLESLATLENGSYGAELMDLRVYGSHFILRASAPGAVAHDVYVPIDVASFQARQLLAQNAIVGSVRMAGTPVANLEVALEVEMERDNWLPMPVSGAHRLAGVSYPSAVRTGAAGEFTIPLPPLAPGAAFRAVAEPFPSQAVRPAIVSRAQDGPNTAPLEFIPQDNASGCSTLPEVAPGVDLGFASVQNILTANCIGCHGNAEPYERLMLDDGFAYSGLVGRYSREVPTRRLVPQDGGPQSSVAESFLLEKLTCAIPTAGGPMPLTAQLSEADRATIANWIAAGAPHDRIAVSAFASAQSVTSPGFIQFYAGAEGPGAPFAFEWHFGDGTTALTPDLIQPAYVAEGEATRTITVTTRNANGVILGAELLELTVTAPEPDPENISPTIQMAHSLPVIINRPTLLTASGSLDPDGEVKIYGWDFDADGTLDRLTSAPTVAHQFSSLGETAVRVLIVDDKNAASEGTMAITVEAPPKGHVWLVY